MGVTYISIRAGGETFHIQLLYSPDFTLWFGGEQFIEGAEGIPQFFPTGQEVI